MVKLLHKLTAPTDKTLLWLQSTVLNMGDLMTKLIASEDVGLPESPIAYAQQRDGRSLSQCSDRVWVLFLPVFPTLQCTC